MQFLKRLTGGGTTSNVRQYEARVGEINALEDTFAALDDTALAQKTGAFKERLAQGEALEMLAPEAFAAVREAAKRTLEQRHFDVQLIGGLVMLAGGIAEMKTGEGKTLVATLPAYTRALLGKGVHVVTVNDYLARRDAVWMGQVYAALGLSVGIINANDSYVYDPGHTEADKGRDEQGGYHIQYEFLRPCSRAEAYNADVTYGTNSEYGFDYLRDNTAVNPLDVRQRSRSFAIIDEIDSILIDEARTPLIISMPAGDSEELYKTFATVVASLADGEHYTVDEKFRSIAMTENGIAVAEAALGLDNIYTDAGVKYVHHLETAVKAKALYNRDQEYVVRDGEVVIVDEFTGRMQPSRRWSEGLHQAIEAKEGVAVKQESRTAASVTYQNYFRMYENLSGMTGTATTSSEEFYSVYGLSVTEIPTNKPIARIDNADLIFQTEQGKFKALARAVKEVHETGQPILIGTVSIEKNELLSAFLKREGVPHEMLNAKNHEQEGEIVAQAGRKGGVTIATNMAGRGVDIKLGGAQAAESEHEAVKATGGLFVFGTERHEARRIDNQLRGRSGRQGDPGTTQFFVSLDDSLMRVFGGETVKKVMGTFGVAEDEPIASRFISRRLESAQTKIEGFHFDARKRVLQYDDVLDRQRKAVYENRRKVLIGDDASVRALLEAMLGDEEDLKTVAKEKEDALGADEFIRVIRRLFLQTYDLFWMQHLEVMDHVRGSVNLRAYGQRDPLVEYKKEGIRLFHELEASIAGQVLELLPHIETGAFARGEAEHQHARSAVRTVSASADSSGAVFDAMNSAQITGDIQRATDSLQKTGDRGQIISRPAHTEAKVGRNDPCLCGSGKKYKKCHGA